MTDNAGRSPPEFDLQRYVAVKRTVEDRAASSRVLEVLREGLGSKPRPRVLDFGAGLGYTLDRLLDREVMPDGTEYIGVDLAPELTAAAEDRLRNHEAVVPRDNDHGAGFEWQGDDAGIRISFQTGDAYSYLQTDSAPWDFVIAQAFLAEPDVAVALDKIAAGLRPGGVCYFPMVFDGITRFEPPVDPGLDEAIINRYHASLEQVDQSGQPGGNPKAGRAVVEAVDARGADLLAVASADWVIYPRGTGYPGDEAYLLHQLVGSIESAVSSREVIDSDRIAEWVETRRDQVSNGQLVFISHRLDILARFP